MERRRIRAQFKSLILTAIIAVSLLSPAAGLPVAKAPEEAPSGEGLVLDLDTLRGPVVDSAHPLFSAISSEPASARQVAEELAQRFATTDASNLLSETAGLRSIEPEIPLAPANLDLAVEVLRNIELRGGPAEARSALEIRDSVRGVPADLRGPLARLVWAVNEAQILRDAGLRQVEPAEIAWFAKVAPRLAVGSSGLTGAAIGTPDPGDASGATPEELARARSISARIDYSKLIAGAMVLAAAVDEVAPILGEILPTPVTASSAGSDAAHPAIMLAQDLGEMLRQAALRSQEEPSSMNQPLEFSIDEMNARWDMISPDFVITPEEHHEFEEWMHGAFMTQAARNVNVDTQLKLHHTLEHMMMELEAMTPPDPGPGLPGLLPGTQSHTTCLIDESTPGLGDVLYLCGPLGDFIGPGSEPPLIVDLGGNDVWANSACGVPPASTAPSALPTNVKLCLDLGGSDFYFASGFGAGTTIAQGAAVGGIAFLADLSGPFEADFYIASQFGSLPGDNVATIAQGSGVAGVGVLIDAGGDDFYSATSWSIGGPAAVHAQGSGASGVGVLADALGADSFMASATSLVYYAATDTAKSGDTFVLAQGAGYFDGEGILVAAGDAGGFVGGDSMIANAYSDGFFMADFFGVPGNFFSLTGHIGSAITVAQGAGWTSGIGVAVTPEIVPQLGLEGGHSGFGFGQSCQATGGAALAVCQGAASVDSVGLLLALGTPSATCFVPPAFVNLCSFGYHSVQALATVTGILMKIDGQDTLTVSLDVAVGDATALCQGSGETDSLGLLVDGLGSDFWSCRATSQGTAMAEAFLLFCPCIQADSYGTVVTGSARDLAQGAAGGGIGVFVDVEGNDFHSSMANTFASVTSCSGPFGGNGVSIAKGQTGEAVELSQGIAKEGLGLHLDLLGNDYVQGIADTSSYTFGWMASFFQNFYIDSDATAGPSTARDKGVRAASGSGVYANLALSSLGLLGAFDSYYTSATSFASGTASPSAPASTGDVVITTSTPGATASDAYGFDSGAGLPGIGVFADVGPSIDEPFLFGCFGDDSYFESPTPPPAAWGSNGGLLCGGPAMWSQGANGVGIDT